MMQDKSIIFVKNSYTYKHFMLDYPDDQMIILRYILDSKFVSSTLPSQDYQRAELIGKIAQAWLRENNFNNFNIYETSYGVVYIDIIDSKDFSSFKLLFPQIINVG